MKKLFLGLVFCLGLTVAANAVIITTSCGTGYNIQNSQFKSVQDMVDFANQADLWDCTDTGVDYN